MAASEMPQADPEGGYSSDFYFWKQRQDTSIDSFSEFKLHVVTDLLKSTEGLRFILVTNI